MKFSYSPFDPEIAQYTYPYYEEMRADGSVHYWEEANIWTISTYEDVSRALRMPNVLSNRAMPEILLGKLPGSEAGASISLDVQPTREQVSGMVVAADPPVHTELRNILNRGFLPPVIKALEPVAMTAIEDLFGKMVEKPEFDLIEDFCSALPVIMIAKMMGVDDEHLPNIREWSDTVVQGMNGSKRWMGPVESGAVEAGINLRAVISETIEKKIKNPDKSLVSTLLQATDDQVLSVNEALGFGSLLLFAGSETTTHLIGNSIFSLLKNPQYLDPILENPELIPNLMEETVRWNGPVQFVFRRALEDVEIGGKVIPKGADVAVLIGAANRDVEKWGEDADQFILERKTKGHLGYGFGVHVCLGAPLARMEARLALEKLLPLMKSHDCVQPDFKVIDSTQFRGFNQLKFQAM